MYEESPLAHNWSIKRLLNRAIGKRIAGMRGVVIDLGCGSRPFAEEILSSANRYVGVDWGNSLHKQTADITADLNAPLPIASECADNVVSFEVLEHLREPELMLSEACRILRPGGKLVLSVPFQWWLHEAPWDYFRYTRHGLDHLLRKAGFSTISIEATSGFWSMWVLKLNYRLAFWVRGSRPRRLLTRGLLVPFWWTNQHLAMLMDNRWPDDRETAGYVATAVKS